MSWQVGSRFCSKHGTLVVLDLDKGMAILEVLDGDQKGEWIEMAVPVEAPQPPKEARYDWHGGRLPLDPLLLTPAVLGFLSARAVLFADVPAKSRAAFMAAYGAARGGVPDEQELANVNAVSDSQKWGIELRATFMASASVVEGLGIAGSVRKDRDGVTVDPTYAFDNGMVWKRLVEMGFRLGTRHDLVALRENVPQEQRPEFDRGRGIGDGTERRGLAA